MPGDYDYGKIYDCRWPIVPCFPPYNNHHPFDTIIVPAQKPRTVRVVITELTNLVEELEGLLEVEIFAKEALLNEAEAQIKEKCLHPETKRVDDGTGVIKFTCAECFKEFV